MHRAWLRSIGIGLWLYLLTLGVPGQVPERLLVQGNVYLNNRPYSGTGELKFALIGPEGTTSYWSNDGSSAGGGEPAKSIRVPVTAGAYSVLLGDPNLAGMLPLPATVFTNAHVQLRTWFSDGVQPFTHLAPDEPFVPVGYAMMSARVAPGAIGSAELAPAAVTRAALAPGAVGPENLAPGTAAANLRAGGSLVASTLANDEALVGSGFTRIATVPADGESWRRLDVTAPPPRQSHLALWSGTEMIILGNGTAGTSQGPYLPGFRYDPKTAAWSGLPATNAPTWLSPQTSTASAQWTAQWIGSQVLVWHGGLRVGRRCDPRGDRWQLMSALGSPTPRYGYSAVWTGIDWIVWGGAGLNNSTPLSDGARYRADKDQWTPISSVGGPPARYGHLAFWTGKAMVVVGGLNITGRTGGVWRYDPERDAWDRLDSTLYPAELDIRTGALIGNQIVVFGPMVAGPTSPSPYSAGARFDLTTLRWSPISPTNAPVRVQSFSTTDTGNEVVLWGGYQTTGGSPLTYISQNRGFAYDPATDTWRDLSSVEAPSPRQNHSAVWTGKELLVWGGSLQVKRLSDIADGGRYRLDEDRWLPLSSPPLTRRGPSLVWTGTELLVWGGTNQFGSALIPSGAAWNPTTGRWRPLATRNEPSLRLRASTVWTGSEWILWGGYNDQTGTLEGNLGYGLANGAIYRPDSDRWRELPSDSAIAPRGNHSAVWTGQEMIVWGGDDRRSGGTPLNSGGRYHPASATWTPLSTRLPSGSLPGRVGHDALWTGREMLVWGGSPKSFSGLRYDPARDRWSELAPGPFAVSNQPDATAVWLGDRMLASFGGQRWATYDPLTDSWRAIASAGAPVWAWNLALFWTGQDVLACGNLPGTGHRYDPGTDTWSRFTSQGAPGTWSGYSAAWAGDKLCLLGGTASNNAGESLSHPIWEYSLTRPIYLYGPGPR